MDLQGNIQSINERSKESIKIEDGDYYSDGLLYCGKCHTQKECRVNFFFGTQICRCMCKCLMEKKEKEEKDFRKSQLDIKIRQYKELGFTDPLLRSFTFENDNGKGDPKYMSAAKKYAEEFPKMMKEAKGLLLFGKCGTGKSYMAASICNYLIDKGYFCYMTNFETIANTLYGKQRDKQEYIDSFNQYPLLVLDDLSSERNTDYMNEIVYTIIDERYKRRLPLIVTTNVDRDEMKNPKNKAFERIYSRLFEMTIPIEVIGVDRRKSILNNEYKSYIELLGLE